MHLTMSLRRAVQIPMELLNHRQQVKSLYKRSVRNLEAHHVDWVQFRIEAVMMRARFDAAKNETDVGKIRAFMIGAEKDLFDTKHPSPLYFPESPGGVAYMRAADTPDWVLDYWHPLERAAYPDYFARRELRKKEFLVWWEKQYGKPSKEEAHH